MIFRNSSWWPVLNSYRLAVTPETTNFLKVLSPPPPPLSVPLALLPLHARIRADWSGLSHDDSGTVRAPFGRLHSNLIAIR